MPTLYPDRVETSGEPQLDATRSPTYASDERMSFWTGRGSSLMPMVRSATVKAAFDKAEHTKARIFEDFKIGTGEKQERVNLVLVDDRDGLKRAFVCNFSIALPIAYRLYQMYGKRWGIETSYRNVEHDFRPRTTSRNYMIRLFYFFFSCCLYNLWVLTNVCVSLRVHGRISPKPIITAKLFVILLYRVHDQIT